MDEVELIAIQTPDGNASYEEAMLIIECKLTQTTSTHPDDFYTQEAKDFIDEAYQEAKVYRQYVFGEITHVWVKR